MLHNYPHLSKRSRTRRQGRKPKLPREWPLYFEANVTGAVVLGVWVKGLWWFAEMLW